MTPVYNYLLESYPIKREVMYPAHKRSELKRVYNNIVSLSRRSPLYKINLSKDNQEYTFGIKETALELKAKLTGMAEPEKSGFDSRTIAVSDERILSARLLKEDVEGLPEEITFQVDSLASVQTNVGKDLMLISRGLPSGDYEFNAKVYDQDYKLTYHHESRMENQEALKKMAEFINLAIPGINAAVELNPTNEYGRLVLVSEQSGKNGAAAFELTDTDFYKTGVVEYFGLDRVEQPSSTAQFSINEVYRQTSTNTFNLEGKLRITLNGTGETPVTVKIVPDSNKILSSVEGVLDTYNRLLKIAHHRTQDGKEHFRASKLIKELNGITQLYREELEACGIAADETGFLSIRDPLAGQACVDGAMESLFTRENGFSARLMDKAESIAINPMEYLEKTVVTYPNKASKTFSNPYVTSMYSGLFFSSYC